MPRKKKSALAKWLTKQMGAAKRAKTNQTGWLNKMGLARNIGFSRRSAAATSGWRERKRKARWWFF